MSLKHENDDGDCSHFACLIRNQGLVDWFQKLDIYLEVQVPTPVRTDVRIVVAHWVLVYRVYEVLLPSLRGI